jgi:hypothetical protein
LVSFSELKVKECLFLTTKSISEKIYSDVRGKISSFFKQIPTRDPIIVACHEPDYSFLHFKYFCTMG